MTHDQCYVYMLDDSVDVGYTQTLDFIRKYHCEGMFAYTNSRPSSVSTHQRIFKALWLSKPAFVIHVYQRREKSGRVLPD